MRWTCLSANIAILRPVYMLGTSPFVTPKATTAPPSATVTTRNGIPLLPAAAAASPISSSMPPPPPPPLAHRHEGTQHVERRPFTTVVVVGHDGDAEIGKSRIGPPEVRVRIVSVIRQAYHHLSSSIRSSRASVVVPPVIIEGYHAWRGRHCHIIAQLQSKGAGLESPLARRRSSRERPSSIIAAPAFFVTTLRCDLVVDIIDSPPPFAADSGGY